MPAYRQIRKSIRRTRTAALLAPLGIAICTAYAAAQREPVPAAPAASAPLSPHFADIDVPIVFVSRQIPPNGSVYWDVPRALPGAGPYSRVLPAAPGQLLVREPGGRIRTLIDGRSPTAFSHYLIDVNGPAVSYDGQTIAFSGLKAGDWNDAPASSVGGWRIFLIDADGGNLRQITFADRGQLDYSQFGLNADLFRTYDDFDPVFLPDGRIAFASTRYPAFAQYSGVRASNLYVVDADGARLHRITAERNGAERPLVDPPTGRIVYSRWWRNQRLACDSLSTVETEIGPDIFGYEGAAYLQHDGLAWRAQDAVAGDDLVRNAWQASFINTDGTGLQMWGLRFRDQDTNQVYGGALTAGGTFYANYFPMLNMSEAAGFGGIRLRFHGVQPWTAIAGVTDASGPLVHPQNPPSFGIHQGSYAAEPEVLPDGRVVISWAPSVQQDYGLYVIEASGAGRALLLDRRGTSELRARVVAPRPLPPILPDVYRDDPARPFASEMPPRAEGPYAPDGTFLFHCLNVYANAPVDADIVSAPAIGSATSIRFYLDHQRFSPGSFPHLDWPIFLGERNISIRGEVFDGLAPANVSLFEQLRGPTPGYRVPLTGGPYPDGAAHVPGMNFGVAGTEARCVGCHAGHTFQPVPETVEEAQWTNVAPGALVTVSSTRDARFNGGLIDRRVARGEIWRTWTSAPNDPQNGQWAHLAFRVPITVRSVTLHNPRPGDEANCSVQVQRATVILYFDRNAQFEVARRVVTEGLPPSGLTIPFGDKVARSVRVILDDVTGTFYGAAVASLGEIEVLARGEDPGRYPIAIEPN